MVGVHRLAAVPVVEMPRNLEVAARCAMLMRAHDLTHSQGGRYG